MIFGKHLIFSTRNKFLQECPFKLKTGLKEYLKNKDWNKVRYCCLKQGKKTIIIWLNEKEEIFEVLILKEEK